MNRTCFIIIVFVCAGLSSCGANKRISATREAESHSIMEHVDSGMLRREIKRLLNERVSENLVMFDNRNISVELETFSEPDSNGRQHVVERLHAEINSETATASENVSESVVEVSEITDSVAVIEKSETAYMHEEDIMDASREPSKWQRNMTWMMFAVAAIVIVVVTAKIIKSWK